MKRPYPEGKEPWRLLPRPSYDKVTDRYTPRWNSVALFFNLTSSDRPGGYIDTSIADASNWLDEGTTRGDPSVKEFVANYWAKLSYGQFGFGINTPRYSSGEPIIPTVPAPGKDPEDWVNLIKTCIKNNPEAIWHAAGDLMKDGRRWIPSVVLIQRYGTSVHATTIQPFTLTVFGHDYEVEDYIHMRYSLDFFSGSIDAIPIVLPLPPGVNVRSILNTLCHEYAHNFLDFGDLYGPQGCTGYWDLLGQHSPPGSMSEVGSVHKERIGWLRFKETIQKSTFPKQQFSLRRYTTSGDAIKVVPDPRHNPYEYFILEYRRSTGNDLWVPDRALPEGGLLITHINERFGGPHNSTYLLRDAPYFDPEFADFSDLGGAFWTGCHRLSGIVFPQGVRNAFTHFTQPSSDFYGPRSSGLSITDIHFSTPGPEEPEGTESDEVIFDLEVDNYTRVGWNVGARDRCVAGRFTGDSLGNGSQEIFCRSDRSIALLECRQAQWFVRYTQNENIDGWSLGRDDYEIVGDLDGDGLDEIYLRSSKYAGVFKWEGTGFRSLSIQNDRIDGWNLGSDNHELAADLDGDGLDEIYIRSPRWAGVLKMIDGKLQLQTIQENSIDRWSLGPDDKELIGKFTQSKYDEILICSSNSIGLLYWKSISPEPDEEGDDTALRLRLRKIHNDRVDGWRLNSSDNHCVVDLDGDGLDEIYIRSPRWVGVLKWKEGRLQVLWMRESNIEYSSDNKKTIPLTEHDRSYGGHFLQDRDGIFHRADDSGVAILTWENAKMQVRQYRVTPLTGIWNLAKNDKFVLGDFHRTGPDIVDPTKDYVTDTLTDVFIHNASGTGMVGFNLPSPNAAKPDEGYDQLQIVWISDREILFRNPPTEDIP